MQFDGSESPALRIECCRSRGVAQLHKFVADPADPQQLDGPRLDAQRPRCQGAFARAVDDADTDAEPRQLEGGGQSGRTCADDQNGDVMRGDHGRLLTRKSTTGDLDTKPGASRCQRLMTYSCRMASPRTRNAAQTRADILAAARLRFGSDC